MQIVNRRILLVVVILATVFLLQTKIFSDDAEEYFRKGHKFYLESKPSEAEAEFKKALEINPKLSDTHYYLGSIYFKQKKYDQAKGQCEQALAINPQDFKSLLILGLSWQRLGQLDLAIDTFQKAIRIDNRSAAAHSALGLAYCAKGDKLKAEKEYNILRKLDPELAEDLLERIGGAGCNFKGLTFR